MGFQFRFLNENKAGEYISYRPGEQKLGENIPYFEDLESLLDRPSLYVILGAEDDLGVAENGGITGTATSWQMFLRSFLNIQSNAYLPVKELAVLGSWTYIDDGMNTREAIEELDHQLSATVSRLVQSGKIPILVGGGHNNAYGMIRGTALGKQSAVNVINLDPHADLRNTEKRHSGNGFSFARQESLLHHYFILALHESYNNNDMLDLIRNDPNISCITFEDIFLRGKTGWDDALRSGIRFVKNRQHGVELDMDAIEHVLASAMTPLGVSARQAARFAYLAGQNAAYFHLAEGVYQRADGLEQKSIGKLQAYLVTAFIKGHCESARNKISNI